MYFEFKVPRVINEAPSESNHWIRGEFESFSWFISGVKKDAKNFLIFQSTAVAKSECDYRGNGYENTHAAQMRV